MTLVGIQAYHIADHEKSAVSRTSKTHRYEVSLHSRSSESKQNQIEVLSKQRYDSRCYDKRNRKITVQQI